MLEPNYRANPVDRRNPMEFVQAPLKNLGD